MNLDPKLLRSAFGRFLTGVTVVTARSETGDPVGFTANSFTSVSLTPPMVLVCPGNHLSSFETFRAADRFGISILSEGQQDLSNLFASGKGDRFGQCEWDSPAAGIPLISGRAAGFVCDTFQRVDAGDHVVLIGRVVHFDDASLPGLGFGPDGYFTRNREREAEAPTERRTLASVLLDDGTNVYLTPDMDLPGMPVVPGDSPLRTLNAELEQRGIRTELSVVYAVYDDGPWGRRIVFRGHVDAAVPGLTTVAITALPGIRTGDEAVRSLLIRFAQEHKTQNFGFYIGDDRSGDVLPV